MMNASSNANSRLMPARREALIKRLREVYKGQGIEVFDRVLTEGVKALKEKRFSYESPRPSLARNLALLWIGRARTGKILLGAFLVLFATWLAYDFFVARPQRLAQEQAATEIAEDLPKTLAADYADVSETGVDTATQYAARWRWQGGLGARRCGRRPQAVTDIDLAWRSARRIQASDRQSAGERTASGATADQHPCAQLLSDRGSHHPKRQNLSRPILNEETGVTS
jgi:hypothetical protein